MDEEVMIICLKLCERCRADGLTMATKSFAERSEIDFQVSVMVFSRKFS